MIALVTSTLILQNGYSLYNTDERLKQTINTVQKLYDAGFQEVYLFDNSINTASLESLGKTFKHLKIFHAPQYTFENKGLNEALLILNNIHVLPENTPIFKISGRYYPNKHFNLSAHIPFPTDIDLIGVGHFFGSKKAYFSTRAYFIKNKSVLESVLNLAIQEMLSYAKGIHGVKSLSLAIRNLFRPYIGTTYQLSLEQAFARIAYHNKKYLLINAINIEGLIAGVNKEELVSE
jgi:hypothetical protein